MVDLAVQVLALVALSVAGAAVAASAGLRGWRPLLIGPMLGAAMVVVVGAPMMLLGARMRPWVLLVVLALGAVGHWIVWAPVPERRGRMRDAIGWTLANAIVAATVTGVVVRSGILVATSDSITYAGIARLLLVGRLDVVSVGILEQRLLGVPLLQSLGGVVGTEVFAPLGPILALATAGLVADASVTLHRRAGFTRRVQTVLAVIGVLLLATVGRFIAMSVYLNGHAAIAAWVLLAATVGLVLAVEDLPPATRPGVALIGGIAAAAVCLTRPEGLALVGIVLLPALVESRVGTQERLALVLPSAIATVGWQTTLAILHRRAGDPIPPAVIGLVVLAALLAVAPTLLDRMRRADRLRIAGPALLAVSAVVLSRRDPGLTLRSVEATVENVLRAGGWGPSFVLIALLLVAASASAGLARRLFLVPVMSFLPLVLVLAHVRDGEYRSGPGDSLNRMWVHVLPLAVVAIVGSLRPSGGASGRGGDQVDARA